VFISASVWYILVFFQAHLVYFRETEVATLAARTVGSDQRWDRIRITGVDSSRILCFSFRPRSGPGVKNMGKTGTGSGVTFKFRQ